MLSVFDSYINQGFIVIYLAYIDYKLSVEGLKIEARDMFSTVNALYY